MLNFNGRLLVFLLLGGVNAWGVGRAWASDGAGFSGSIGVEGGAYQPADGSVQPYVYSRLFMEDHEDLDPSLSLGLAGEADWQGAPIPMLSAWPLYAANNYLNLQADNLSSSDGGDFYTLRLDRAFLHWASGSLEASAGLWKPDWGGTAFYRPTDYFNPLPALAWQADQPLASEGLDATCFLFDDLSLEGAVRWLEGGDAEGVVRLVDKGIGITFTPSLSWMTGRNGLGLEMAGTFPNFQVRLEGVDWLYADGHTAADWTAELSTVHKGIRYTAEILGDNTGEILGSDSNGSPRANYIFLSAEGTLEGKWKIAPGLLTPLGGGPFLFWPKASWDFSPSWKLSFQAQLLLGNWPGPLALAPGRCGLSVHYSF